MPSQFLSVATYNISTFLLLLSYSMYYRCIRDFIVVYAFIKSVKRAKF